MTVTTSQVRAMVEDQSSKFEPLDDEAEYEFDDDPEYGRSSFFLIIAFIVVGIFFVGVIWFAYQQGIRTGQTMNPPLITADTGTVKVIPSQDGQDETPFQDSLVLNDETAAGIDQVMPETEEPLEPPASGVSTSRLEATSEATDAAEVAPPADAGPGVSANAEETLDTLAVPSPNPERIARDTAGDTGAREVPAPTEVEQTSQTGAEPPAQPERTAATDAAEAQSEPQVLETAASDESDQAVSKVEPVAAADVPEPRVLSPEATEAARVEQAAEEARTATSGVDPTSGAYVVQILSSPDRAQAADERDSFALRFKDLLADRGMDIQRADLGAKGIYYRVRIGPFADRGGAGQYCNQLKARGQECFVTKP